MKEIRGDKPIGVIIHINMEIPQGNSLCSHLCLKLRCYVFPFISYKIGEQEGGTSPAQEVGLEPVGVGRCCGKGVGR
jgi:hypothetical protein